MYRRSNSVQLSGRLRKTRTRQRRVSLRGPIDGVDLSRQPVQYPEHPPFPRERGRVCLAGTRPHALVSHQASSRVLHFVVNARTAVRSDVRTPREDVRKKANIEEELEDALLGRAGGEGAGVGDEGLVDRQDLQRRRWMLRMLDPKCQSRQAHAQ